MTCVPHVFQLLLIVYHFLVCTAWDHYIIMPSKGSLVFALKRVRLSTACLCRGSYWGSLRAAAQPMFHKHNLIQYAGVIREGVDALISNLRASAKIGEQVDLHQQLGRMSMQIIGATAFGYCPSSLSDGHACNHL